MIEVFDFCKEACELVVLYDKEGTAKSETKKFETKNSNSNAAAAADFAFELNSVRAFFWSSLLHSIEVPLVKLKANQSNYKWMSVSHIFYEIKRCYFAMLKMS